MNKKTIKKNINEATKAFRKTLENMYLEPKKPFYYCGHHSLMHFFSGKITHTRLKNGNLKISGEVGKIALRDEIKGLPRNIEDWKIFPIVVTLFQEDVGTDPNKEKNETKRKSD